jgi:hypothetical protein
MWGSVSGLCWIQLTEMFIIVKSYIVLIIADL